jgi:hypothetical protein
VIVGTEYQYALEVAEFRFLVPHFAGQQVAVDAAACQKTSGLADIPF